MKYQRYRIRIVCGFYVIQFEKKNWWGRIKWESFINSTGTSLYHEASDAKKDLDEIIKEYKVAAGTYFEQTNGELILIIIK